MGVVSQTSRPGIHVYEATQMQWVHIYSGTNPLFTVHRDVFSFDMVWRTAGEQLAGVVPNAAKSWHYFVDREGIKMVPENMIVCRISDMMNAYRFHKAKISYADQSHMARMG